MTIKSEQSPSQRSTYWKNHIQAWHASGQTQTAYCRTHRLKLHQLRYWNCKFEPSEAGKPKALGGGFVPVRISQRPSEGLALVFPNGVKLEGINGANASLVRQILEWLKSSKNSH